MNIVKLTTSTLNNHIVDSLNVLLPQLTNNYFQLSIDYLQSILLNNTIILLAKSNDNIITGTCSIILITTLTGIKCRLEDLIVHKDYRNMGIASNLLNEAIQIAKINNCISIELTSKPSRIEANKLYLKIGFIPRETNTYIMYI